MLAYRFEFELRLVELLHEPAVVQDLVEHHLLQAHRQTLQVRVHVAKRILNLQDDKNNI